MKKVFLAVLLSMTLALLSIGSAFAQDTGSVLCGDLAEEDCGLLEASQEAMRGVTSATSQTELIIVVENIPDMPAEVGIAITLEDAFEVSPETWDLADAVKAEFANAMMGDVETLLEVYSEMVPGVARDMVVTIELSPDVSAMIVAEGGPEIDSISVSMMLVDGILYLNLEDLATIIPELGMFAGWIGLDFVELVNFGFEQVMVQAEESGDMSAIASMLSALAIGMPTTGNGDVEALATYGYPINAWDHLVDAERLEDEVLDGIDIAVFYMTLDNEALLADPGIQQMITAQIAGQTGQEMTAEMMEDTEAMIEEMGPMIANAIVVDLFQGVGLEDLYTYATEIHFSVDTAELAEMDEEVAAMAEAGVAPVMTMDMSALYGDVNADLGIEAPAGALVLPMEMLMSMAGGM